MDEDELKAMLENIRWFVGYRARWRKIGKDKYSVATNYCWIQSKWGEMKTITIDINGKQAIAFKPSETDVLSLCVGDAAPDCFGKLKKVTRLYAAARDINGKA